MTIRFRFGSTSTQISRSRNQHFLRSRFPVDDEKRRFSDGATSGRSDGRSGRRHDLASDEGKIVNRPSQESSGHPGDQISWPANSSARPSESIPRSFRRWRSCEDEPLDFELPISLARSENLKKNRQGKLGPQLDFSSPFLSWSQNLSDGRNSAFFNDLEVVASFSFIRRAEQDADGRASACLRSPCQILGSDFELQDRGLFSFELGDNDFFGLVHERLRSIQRALSR